MLSELEKTVFHALAPRTVVFPPQQDLDASARLLIRAVGENPGREGLERTPERFAKSFMKLCEGYGQTPEQVVGKGIFPAEGSGLVCVRDIEFFSLCEHHILPFWGKATVAYYPAEKILGLSKIPRLVDVFARRFQVQERLTQQVAQALDQLLQPRALAVHIKAEHMCVKMRGVQKQNGLTATEFVIGEQNLLPYEKDRLWASIGL